MKHLMTAAALAAVAFAGTANAALVFSNALETTEISQSGLLDKFDSSLGTLTGVTLSWNGEAVTNITLTNTAAQAQNVLATGTVTLFFSSSTDAGISALLSSIALSMPASGGAVLNLAPNQPTTFGPDSDADSASVSFGAGAAELALFAGNAGDTFSVDCISLSGLTLQGGGGNVIADQSTQAACGASVEYTFDRVPPPQVPEPGTLALLGACALGAAGFARRARKA